MKLIQVGQHLRGVSGLLAGLMWLIASGSPALAASAADPAQKAQSAILRLSNGDFTAGELVDSPDGENLLWKSAGFADHFRFPLHAVKTIDFPIPDKLPQPEGTYCFELPRGDVLIGSLVSLDGDVAVLDIPEMPRHGAKRPGILFPMGRARPYAEILMPHRRRASRSTFRGATSRILTWRSALVPLPRRPFVPSTSRSGETSSWPCAKRNVKPTSPHCRK